MEKYEIIWRTTICFASIFTGKRLTKQESLWFDEYVAGQYRESKKRLKKGNIRVD